ncbi:TPA: DMT family transporter [Pseudomonas aeruginosa]|jgi:drug/metabolite transporter (DMT)-like permease|nr:DMT family transporter [Pseudomonas aeruginosa]HCW0510181.1 DMT family transporter [Pseudomonas aeruginosa]HCW0859295.1 DMT family transporter [Pseudomonas aeruginosa]HCW0863566.1 DMT family transporter [Pseudomonas aeruginosa]HXI06176.1 DMT family transporter [Bradyrhizobium sp.]
MRSENAFGVLCGLAAVFIWSAFIIASRFGVRTHLTPWDIVAIRFAVAGAILLPYLIRRGLALERLGWAGLAAIVIGCGAPCVLLVNVGLLFAPAAHAGALYPGGTPLMVAVLAIVFLGETPSPSKTIGLSLIVLGALCLVFGNGGTIGTQQNLGQALFLAAAFVWGGYTIAMRRAQLDGLHAAAIAAVVSLVLYLPPYLYFNGLRVLSAPAAELTLQAVVQGVLTAIVALLLYGRTVSILGATRAAAFVALTPVVTAILSIPTLGERPSVADWISVAIVSAGVYIVGGGRLPARIARANAA